MEEKKDIELVCGDCKNTFVWTKGEQKFLYGLLNDGRIKGITTPKRCPDCRQTHKQNRFNRANEDIQ